MSHFLLNLTATFTLVILLSNIEVVIAYNQPEYLKCLLDWSHYNNDYWKSYGDLDYVQDSNQLPPQFKGLAGTGIFYFVGAPSTSGQITFHDGERESNTKLRVYLKYYLSALNPQSASLHHGEVLYLNATSEVHWSEVSTDVLLLEEIKVEVSYSSINLPVYLFVDHIIIYDAGYEGSSEDLIDLCIQGYTPAPPVTAITEPTLKNLECIDSEIELKFYKWQYESFHYSDYSNTTFENLSLPTAEGVFVSNHTSGSISKPRWLVYTIRPTYLYVKYYFSEGASNSSLKFTPALNSKNDTAELPPSYENDWNEQLILVDLASKHAKMEFTYSLPGWSNNTNKNIVIVDTIIIVQGQIINDIEEIRELCTFPFSTARNHDMSSYNVMEF